MKKMCSKNPKNHLDKIDFTTRFSNTPRYFIAGGVLIHSFIKNHQDIKHIKIHILEDNVSPANKKKIQQIVDTDAKNYNLNIELAWIDITEEIKWCQDNNIPPYHGSYSDVCCILSLSHIQPISDILVSADATCLFDANLTKLWTKFKKSDKAIWNPAPLGFTAILFAFNLKHFPDLIEPYRQHFIKTFHQEIAAEVLRREFSKKYHFPSPQLIILPEMKPFRKPKFYKWQGKHIFPPEINANPHDLSVIRWKSYAQETLFLDVILPKHSDYIPKSPNFLQRFTNEIKDYTYISRNFLLFVDKVRSFFENNGSRLNPS